MSIKELETRLRQNREELEENEVKDVVDTLIDEMKRGNFKIIEGVKDEGNEGLTGFCYEFDKLCNEFQYFDYEDNLVVEALNEEQIKKKLKEDFETEKRSKVVETLENIGRGGNFVHFTRE